MSAMEEEKEEEEEFAFEEYDEIKMHEKCKSRMAELLIDGNIQFLLYSLYKRGCTKSISFSCQRCDNPGARAYFTMKGEEPQIAICENNSLWGIKQSITHELVHAFDYCRADLDNTSCKELACTEIRASMLSGECALSREMLRGKFGFSGHMKECVKRRATKSVLMHPQCAGIIGEKAILDVFDTCYADREPFGTIPRKDKSVF